MDSFVKIASQMVLPLSLALVMAGCVAQPADEEPSTGEVAQADNNPPPNPSPSGPLQQQCQDGDDDGGNGNAGGPYIIPGYGTYPGYGGYGYYPSYGYPGGYGGYGGYGYPGGGYGGPWGTTLGGWRPYGGWSSNPYILYPAVGGPPAGPGNGN